MDQKLRERILRRGIWNIAGKPMFLSRFGPEGSIADQPPLESMPIWVIVKNIPPSMFSWKGISFLTSILGCPKRLHPDTEACKMFDQAKVLVEVDLRKELQGRFKFHSKSGITMEISYEFPWLPPRCQACQRWGHLSRACKAIRREMEPSLHAPPTIVSQPAAPETGKSDPLLTSTSPPDIEFSRENTSTPPQSKLTLPPVFCQEQIPPAPRLPQAKNKGIIIENRGPFSNSEDPSSSGTAHETLLSFVLPSTPPKSITSPDSFVNNNEPDKPDSIWQLVSPASKKQSSSTSCPVSPIKISPSRFSVLQTDDPASSGETQQVNPVSNQLPPPSSHSLDSPRAQETTTNAEHRNSSRPTRSINKLCSEFEAQKTSISLKPGVVNKRKSKKKC